MNGRISMMYKIQEINSFPSIDRVETGKRIKQYMDIQGLSVKDVKEFLHLGSVQSIYHWIEGKTLPSMDNLFALGILFGVMVDDIVSSEHTPPKIFYDYTDNSIPHDSGRPAMKCSTK